MRGPEHLRRVLPREAYVTPDPSKRLEGEQSTRRRVMEHAALHSLHCLHTYTYTGCLRRHVPLLFIERFEEFPAN